MTLRRISGVVMWLPQVLVVQVSVLPFWTITFMLWEDRMASPVSAMSKSLLPFLLTVSEELNLTTFPKYPEIYIRNMFRNTYVCVLICIQKHARFLDILEILLNTDIFLSILIAVSVIIES